MFFFCVEGVWGWCHQVPAPSTIKYRISILFSSFLTCDDLEIDLKCMDFAVLSMHSKSYQTLFVLFCAIVHVWRKGSPTADEVSTKVCFQEQDMMPNVKPTTLLLTSFVRFDP